MGRVSRQPKAISVVDQPGKKCGQEGKNELESICNTIAFSNKKPFPL
jgi:hypothetical protein